MVKKDNGSEDTSEEKKETIICRCEEVSEKEIREAIRKFNLDTVSEVKRVTRAGMGLCQGRSCEPAIRRILSEETGNEISEIDGDSTRPPTIPVETGVVADIIRSEDDHDEV